MLSQIAEDKQNVIFAMEEAETAIPPYAQKRIRRGAGGQSRAWPAVSKMERRRPLASAIAWIFVLRPPRERPIACFCSPLFRPRPSGAL